MTQNPEISVVIPLYNEDESLPELTRWIKQVMDANHFTYEVILVDDGSRDNSWKVLTQLAAEDEHIKGLRFTRNHGKSAALNTGFKKTSGNVVITLDADLQDSPEEIPALYKMITEDGYDMVSGWKQKRYDPISKTLPSKFFNGVTRWMSGIQLNDFNCGLKAYKGNVVKAIDLYGEMHRYIPLLAKWAGYGNIGEKVVQHRARKYGVTKFGLERFVYGFLDLLSIMVVGKFRKRPMHFFGALGSVVFTAGVLITLYMIGEKLYFNLVQHVQIERPVTEKPGFFLALTSVVVGVQLFVAGFLGELLTNLSGRNEYGVGETLNI